MPLRDLLVVDLTHVVAGPMATKTLRDLGARVIKVEKPSVRGVPGDVTRYFEPRLREPDGSRGPSAYFAMLNSGKESIVLQLDSKHGDAISDRAVFEALLSNADVLVENFRPGVLDTLGYSWEFLHRKYPKLILASISGFGQTGPYAHRKGVDTIIQAMSGFITNTGFPDHPVKVGTTVSDLLAGVYCAAGVLAALHQRHRSGSGSHVDTSMLDTSFAFHGREVASYEVNKVEPPRMGNTSPIGVYPFDTFECMDGKFFAVSCGTDDAFATFSEIIGAPELAKDERFLKPSGRWANREELKAKITKQTKQWDRNDLLQKLLKLRGSGSFPVGPVNTFADVVSDPQILHRGMLRKTQSGRYTITGNPIKIVGSDDEESHISPDPPELGADGPKIRAEVGLGGPSLKARL